MSLSNKATKSPTTSPNSLKNSSMSNLTCKKKWMFTLQTPQTRKRKANQNKITPSKNKDPSKQTKLTLILNRITTIRKHPRIELNNLRLESTRTLPNNQQRQINKKNKSNPFPKNNPNLPFQNRKPLLKLRC